MLTPSRSLQRTNISCPLDVAGQQNTTVGFLVRAGGWFSVGGLSPPQRFNQLLTAVRPGEKAQLVARV
jgi:hypothetical protein